MNNLQLVRGQAKGKQGSLTIITFERKLAVRYCVQTREASLLNEVRSCIGTIGNIYFSGDRVIH